jgi:hypothetical protein
MVLVDYIRIFFLHFPILLTDDCIFMISVNFIKKISKTTIIIDGSSSLIIRSLTNFIINGTEMLMDLVHLVLLEDFVGDRADQPLIALSFLYYTCVCSVFILSPGHAFTLMGTRQLGPR